MSGTILKSESEALDTLWRDYWASLWHVPLNWSQERLRCFLSATEGRQIGNRAHGDTLVTDLPRGRRPFLGVVTNAGTVAASPDSGVLQYTENGHLLTVAPTRSGKGACQIVPNLLLYGGSCMVIDIKGENFDITSAQRERMYEGAKTLKFAPFDDFSDRYNPLDFIRVSESPAMTADTFDDARLLAEMLMGSKLQQDFWELEARGLLTVILIYVATRYRPDTPLRTMRTVVSLLFPAGHKDDRSSIHETLDEIAAYGDLVDNAILLSLVTQFRDHEKKVQASILSTCRSGMSIWLSPRLQKATEYSDFQFSDLKSSMCRPVDQDPAPTTLYVVIPPEFLTIYRPVLRMLVGLAAVELTRPHGWATEDNLQSGWRRYPPCPVLFLLDEFPSLGHMAPIEQGVAYLAGYGVQIWTFVQSLGQLKEIYQDNWTTFVSNAGVASYFGTTDPDLCDYLHKQLGNTAEYELRYETTSTAEGSSSSWTSGQSSSWSFGSGGSDSRGDSSSDTSGSSTTTTVSEQVRFKQDPVATVSEIRAMPSDLQLVFLRNQRPLLATLVPYFRTELFQSLYGEWQR